LAIKTVADMADLSPETVRDFEEGRPVNASLVDVLRVTLESIGGDFGAAGDQSAIG